MGIHEYPCPVCHHKQRIKAQPGEVVEVEACEACRQASDTLKEGGLEEEVTEALDAYDTRSKKQRR